MNYFKISVLLLCFVVFAKSQIEITPLLTVGTAVQFAELPFLISIQQGSVHLCTGSLISEKFSLSSGRCNSDRNISRLTIEYGSSIINPGNNTRQNIVGVSKIIFHPNFNFTTIENDIVIIESKSEIRLSNFYEAYAHIASSGARFSSGMAATHAGWGDVAPGVRSKLLHRSNLRIISHAECIEAAGETKYPFFNTICAMDESVVCAGDLGAPLLVNRVVVGISSFRNGDECVMTPGRYPNAYIAVSFYTRWIEQVTGITYRVNTFLSRN